MGPRVLILTPDRLGRRMGGMGIRHWEIAHALARDLTVTLSSPYPCELESEAVEIVHATADDVKRLATSHDVIVLQGDVLHRFPFLREVDRPMVFDLVCPMHLEELSGREALPQTADPSPGVDRASHQYWFAAHLLQEQLVRGDFFLCASHRQLDFWVGMLSAAGRFVSAPLEGLSLDELIAVLPHGVPDRSFDLMPDVPEALPEVSEGDFVLLWGGGIWNWLDPKTALLALERLRNRDCSYQLVFLGTQHPSPGVWGQQRAREARELADSMGLTGQGVIFVADWVPYDRRHGYLATAHAGICCHHAGLEARYSYRTRMTDCLWAGIPFITTEGGTVEDEIRDRNVVVTVPDRDVATLCTVVERVRQSAPATLAEDCRRAADRLRWSRVIEPLRDFCLTPRRAPDLPVRVVPPSTLARGFGPRYYVAEGLRVLRDEGVGSLGRRMMRSLGKS